MPKKDNLSPQTASFIFIFVLALFAICVCLILWSNLVSTSQTGQNNSVSPPVGQTQDYLKNTKATEADKPVVVNTSAWETYTNKKFGFSFKYKPGWKVLAEKKQNDFTVLQIDPGTKYYNIKIYISGKEFYVMDGLPAKSETIGGAPALNVSNALYGIRANNLYYTFDVGLSMSLVPEFSALVHTVQFPK